MIKEGNERVKQEKNAKRIELFPPVIDDRKYWTNRELRTFIGPFNCPTRRNTMKRKFLNQVFHYRILIPINTDKNTTFLSITWLPTWHLKSIGQIAIYELS